MTVTMQQPQDHPPSSNYNPHYINNDGEVEQSLSSSSQVTTAEAEADAAAMKKSSSLSSWRWIKLVSGLLFIAFITYVIG